MTIRRTLLTASLSLLTLPAFADEGTALVLEDIEIAPGVTVDIHTRIYQNDLANCRAGAILAVHGTTATASGLEPLALALTEEGPGGRPVCQVVTMDLPGHGASPPPTGMVYGDMTVQDYAQAFLGTLERLPGEGIRPITVAGHSLGGLVIQLAQQALVDDGTNLRDSLDVRHAIMFSPGLPGAVPWAFRDAGSADYLLATFSVSDAELGDVFVVPAVALPALYFSRLDGTLASTAVTSDVFEDEGWVSPESLAAFTSMMGIAPQAAPHVDAGIFADAMGTSLDLVAFEQDSVLPAVEQEALFTHLTGLAPSEPGYFVVPGIDAVHGMPQADPDGLIDALEDEVALP